MSTIQYENVSYHLKKMHTKQLLNLFRMVRYHSNCPCCGEWLSEDYSEQIVLLRQELSLREHIPNKKETKQIRKQKQINQKNKKQKKYVNHR